MLQTDRSFICLCKFLKNQHIGGAFWKYAFEIFAPCLALFISSLETLSLHAFLSAKLDHYQSWKVPKIQKTFFSLKPECKIFSRFCRVFTVPSNCSLVEKLQPIDVLIKFIIDEKTTFRIFFERLEQF